MMASMIASDTLPLTAPHRPVAEPRQNRLLAALPDADWHRWQTQLEPVDLAFGEVLNESGSTPGHVYFPTTAVVSLLYMTENGGSSEIAVVGNDGVVGISLFMGGTATPGRSVVQSAGLGFRLRAQTVRDEVGRAGPVLHLFLRYTQALIAQVAQTAACNRHHSIEQLLCRRLLLGLDLLPSDELAMTQDLLANLLGVRREGITAAALKLQEAGVIRYRRGRIAVLDRPRLERRSCECYAAVRNEYDRLLPMSMPTPPRRLSAVVPIASPRPQPAPRLSSSRPPSACLAACSLAPF